MIRSGVGKTPRVRAADPQGVYRAVLTSLLSDGNTVADYIAGTGVTGTLNVSSWANQIGSAPALTAAGGAQPVNLPFSGSKYLYCPAVASNSVSTPLAAANTITDDICITWDGSVDNLTQATFPTMVSTYTAAQPGWHFGLFNTTGKPYFFYNGVSYQASVTWASAGLSSGTRYKFRVFRDRTNSRIRFYYSTDNGASFTQLGADVVATNGAMARGTNGVYIGSHPDGTESIGGKCYGVEISTTLGGSAVVSMDPNLSVETTTNGATWTSATGEVWTLNNTGAKPAQIAGSAQLLLDGSGHYLTSAMGDIAKPTVYLVAKQITWSSGDKFFDTTGRVILQQYPTTPKLCLYAGSLAPEDAGLAVGSYGVVCAQFNGASSLIQVNGGTASVGNAGSGTTGATLYFGSDVVGGTNGNFQAKEFIVRTSTDSAATRALIYQYLRAIHGTP